MKHALTIGTIAAALTGCAMTPQQMSHNSNWDVCRLSMRGPHAQVAEMEAQRRGLDCRPYYGAILQQQQNENAAVQNFLRATQPPPAPALNPQVNCTSHRVGNSVQTSCW